MIYSINVCLSAVQHHALLSQNSWKISKVASHLAFDCYCLSKKALPLLCSKLLYKLSEDFSDLRYISLLWIRTSSVQVDVLENRLGAVKEIWINGITIRLHSPYSREFCEILKTCLLLYNYAIPWRGLSFETNRLNYLDNQSTSQPLQIVKA